MDNTDLILVLGLGLVAVALAIVIPPASGRPVWLPMVLGILGAALGALAALTVIAR